MPVQSHDIGRKFVCQFAVFIVDLRSLTGKTHPQIKLWLGLTKSMNMGIWVVGTLNQLFI